LVGEGEVVASGGVALRFRDVDVDVSEVVVGAFSVAAFCLGGDGVTGNDFVRFMEAAVRVLLRIGESADVFSYEYCCNAAPKLGEGAS